MANVRKRISELTPLTSASLDTTIVGVDNGITYKIELDTLADAVTSRVNILDRDRLSSLESVTSSFETKGRSILSGSVSYTSLTNIPQGIVSQSTDLSSLNQFTASYFTDSASFKSEITTEKNRIDAILSASNANSDTFAEVVSLINSVDLTNDNAFATFYTASNSRLTSLENSTGSYLTSLNGAISSSSQLTSSYDTRYVISGSITQTTWDNIASKPSDIVSGSSQLTASYDLRYTLSGSITQTTWDNIENKPAGIISSSGQIIGLGYATTSSLNSFTSSYNTDSSSFNSRFNGLVTTGSNTFSGSQVFSGSMTVTSGQIVASLITANTSSLYLTSGSNMYVQNNGVVEITGSLKVKGTARFETVGGDEGGEIEFGVPQTNTTLSTSVKADIYQNKLRIFDGNTNGVFIDLSKAPTEVAGEITWKSSGIVNAGTFVQLDNIKATIPSSGNRALALVTTSGTISGYISAHYQGIIGGSSGIAQSISLSTSTNTAIFGWNFGQQGDTSHYILRDDTNNRVYRFVVIIGGSYNNNFISIERLH